MFRAATVRKRAQFVGKKSTRLLTRAALNAAALRLIPIPLPIQLLVLTTVSLKLDARFSTQPLRAPAMP